MKGTLKNRKSLYFILLLIVGLGTTCIHYTQLSSEALENAQCQGSRAVAIAFSMGFGSDPSEDPGSPGLDLTAGPEQSGPVGLTELEFGFFGDFDPIVRHQNAEINSDGIAVDPVVVASYRLHGSAGNSVRAVATPRVYFTNGPRNQVGVFDTATKSFVASIPVGSRPRGIAITPDGKFLYVANQASSSVSVIQVESLEVTDTIAIPGGGSPYGVAVTPDGGSVYVATADDRGRIFVIDTETRTVVETIRAGRQLRNVAVSPDGTLAYVTSNGDGRVFIIDVLTNTVLRALKARKAYAIAFQPYGNAVFVTSESRVGKVTMFDIATNQVLGEWKVGEFPLGITTSRGGLQVYVTNRDSDFITVIDPNREEVAGTLSVRQGLGPIVLLPRPIG